MSYNKKLQELANKRRHQERLAIAAYVLVVVLVIFAALFYAKTATAQYLVQRQTKTEVQNLPDRDSNSRFSYTGYALQGLVLSRPSGYNVAGESSKKNGSLAKTELGIYASYSFRQNIDLRGGIKYDPTGTFEKEPHLTFGLIDVYADSGDVGIRLGRVRNFFGFSSDTRDNPAVRGLDFQPQAIYREAFRSISSTGDGVQLYANKATEDYGTFSTEFTLAKPILKPQRELVEGFFGFPVPGSYAASKSASLTSLTVGWKSPHYKWATHYTISDLDLRYLPGHNDPIVGEPTSMAMQLHTVGIRRYFDGWDITGEMLYLKRQGEVWRILRRQPTQQNLQPMGIAVYSRIPLDESWTAFIGFNVWYNNIHDRRGTGLASLTGLPAHRFYAKSLGLGVRYNTDDWIWRAEMRYVDGTATLSATDNPVRSGGKGRYTFVSTSLTYKF